MRVKPSTIFPLILLLSLSDAFCFDLSLHSSIRKINRGQRTLSETAICMKRRELIALVSVSTVYTIQKPSFGADFTPGGTLVDREVGVQVGNKEASASRKPDNSNVLFDKDFYFKFGTAAAWLIPDSTDFPKTMPFTLSQQRYDTLKKYGDRIKSGVLYIKNLKAKIDDGDYATIPGPDAPEYMLRPMGLLANGFLASANSGEPNELFLARWYINEMFLDLNDIRNAASKEEALKAYNAMLKSMDSYFTMMNRVITAKVGDKFPYVTL